MSGMTGFEKADFLYGSYDVRKMINDGKFIVMKSASPDAYNFLPFQRSGSDKEAAALIPVPHCGLSSLCAGAGTAVM